MIQTDRYTLLCGNNMDLIQSIPDNSIDAIITDPPYGLGKQPDAIKMLQAWLTEGHCDVKGSGFMGKSWDAFVPQPAFWKECFRVLKPGGNIAVFAGTRTMDLMGLSLRIAGFEIRDTLGYMYGCLSEDTEILTKEGWVRYSPDFKKKSVELYTVNIKSKEIFLENITKWFEYEYEDTAYNIKSAFTDQLVSRGHNSIVEQNGKYVFKKAENLQALENVPVLEDVQELLETIYNNNTGTSSKKQILQLSVSPTKKTKYYAYRTAERCYSAMCCLWKRNVQEYTRSTSCKESDVLKKMQRYFTNKIFTRNISRKNTKQMDGVAKRSVQRKDKRREQSFLEGWCNLSKSERFIFKTINKIRSLSERVYSYGAKGRLCYGTPFESCSTNKQTFNTDGMRSSYRPRRNQQQYKQLNVIQEQFRPQAFRARANCRNTMATVTPTFYKGIMFCPQTKAGAFIAKRNGKIFITGNSGFPKSHNISKFILNEIQKQIELQTNIKVIWK